MQIVSFLFLPIIKEVVSQLINFWLSGTIARIRLVILTSENDGITLENFELVHLGLGKLNNRVVVLGRVLDLQLVWRLLLLKNRRREVFLSIEGGMSQKRARYDA